MGLESELSLGCRKPTITQPANCRCPPDNRGKAAERWRLRRSPRVPALRQPHSSSLRPPPLTRAWGRLWRGESLPRAVGFIKPPTEGRVGQGQGSATPRYGRDPAPPCDPAPRLWQHQHPADTLDTQAKACPELGNQNPVSTRLPAKSPRHAWPQSTSVSGGP